MKRCLALFLIICLLPLYAFADTEQVSYALIASDKPTDRLNLREKPDSQSETLGRFYNGTQVEVIEKGNVWSYVRVGNRLWGYMMNEYLVFYNDPDSFVYGREMQGRETGVFRAWLEYGGGLYDFTTDMEPFRVSAGEEVLVLGDINDDWLMVTQSSYLSNVACYVRRQDLASRYTHGLAVVVSKNAEDCLNLRSEPRDDARVLGKYYAGTVVAVHDTQNGFAKVSVIGEGRNYSASDPQEQAGFLQGYMKLDYLRLGSRADWIGTDNCLPMAHVQSAQAHVYDINKERKGTLARGMNMLVLGAFGNGDFLHVDTGEADPVLIRAADVKIDYSAHTPGDMPVIGYGVIRDLEDYEVNWGFVPVYPFCEKTDAVGELHDGQTVAITSLGDTWAQVNCRGEDGYLPAENLECYLLDDIIGDRTAESGSYQVGQDMKSGLYTYRCSEGEQMKVTRKNGLVTQLGGDGGEYTLYLSVGDSIELQGGTIAPMQEDQWFVEPGRITFSGSGRYLCGEHLRSASYWEYQVRPLDPAREAYYEIATLAYDAHGDGECTRVTVTDEPGQFFLVYDGELLEFHNCVITIHYGNG